jgi:hypothetical protein
MYWYLKNLHTPLIQDTTGRTDMTGRMGKTGRPCRTGRTGSVHVSLLFASLVHIAIITEVKVFPVSPAFPSCPACPASPVCPVGWADFWIFWIFNRWQPAADVRCYSKTKVEKAFFFISCLPLRK